MLASGGCIVVSEPNFEQPTRTRPQLTPTNPAIADLRPHQQISPGQFAPITFSADLVSEDAGDDLNAILLLNYGVPNPVLADKPWELPLAEDVITPASLLDPPRHVDLTYTPSLTNTSHDCKSITMIVTHEKFNRSPYELCPKLLDDSASLTWFVPYCERFDQCDANDCFTPSEPVYCPPDPAQALQELAE